MPIRYTVEIEHMANGQTSMGMRAEQRGEVSPYELMSAEVVGLALKEAMETIRKLSSSSQYAEGHSAEVLKKVIEKQRKDVNRFPDKDGKKEGGGG